MSNLYRSHGKHCLKRSFQTSCSKCGENVLFWECVHGCKVFFDLPSYSKLIRHRCKPININNMNKHNPFIVKIPSKTLTTSRPCCPVCGKVFPSDGQVQDHLRQMKKIDASHKKFITTGMEDCEDWGEGSDLAPESVPAPSPRFGTIGFKKKS